MMIFILYGVGLVLHKHQETSNSFTVNFCIVSTVCLMVLMYDVYREVREYQYIFLRILDLLIATVLISYCFQLKAV